MATTERGSVATSVRLVAGHERAEQARDRLTAEMLRWAARLLDEPEYATFADLPVDDRLAKLEARLVRTGLGMTDQRGAEAGFRTRYSLREAMTSAHYRTRSIGHLQRIARQVGDRYGDLAATLVADADAGGTLVTLLEQLEIADRLGQLEDRP